MQDTAKPLSRMFPTNKGLDLKKVEQTAKQRMDTLLPQLMKATGVTEELKARDQMAWVGLVSNCQAQADEIILTELVYV